MTIKNKKGFGFFILGIVAVITFAVGAIVGTQLSNAQLGPRINFINAHACGADEICEVKSLQTTNPLATNIINGRLFVLGQETARVTLFNGYLAIEDSSNQSGSALNIARLSFYDSDSMGRLSPGLAGLVLRANNSGEMRINSEEIRLTNIQNPIERTEISNDFVNFNSLGGNGSAFVCVNFRGGLYRSQTPRV